MSTAEIGPTVVEIPPKNNSAEEEKSSHQTCEQSKDSPASAPSSLESSEQPAAWEGINWSHAKGGKTRHSRSRSLSETSNSSFSTDESSRSSVDLQDVTKDYLFVPTMAVLPNNAAAAAAASASHPVGGATNGTLVGGGGAFNNPYQQRPRRPTELLASQSSSGASGIGSSNPSSLRSSGGIQHGDSVMGNAASSILSLQRLRRSQQASITARSRRSLFFLFLIAVYTTFGLTVHNLPVAPELEFTGVNFESTATTTKTVVSADVLPEKIEDLSQAQLRAGADAAAGSGASPKHGAGIQNHMAFARRTKQKVFVRRPKEIKDFYQQQALAEHVDYSFFINCSVLVAVALWAWRERRNIADSSLRAGGGDETAAAAAAFV